MRCLPSLSNCDMGLFGLGLAVWREAILCGTLGTAPSSSASKSANIWLGFDTFCNNSNASLLCISPWKNACCNIQNNFPQISIGAIRLYEYIFLFLSSHIQKQIASIGDKTRLTWSNFSAVGLFLGFFVRATLTKLWNVGLHLSRSFNVGGLKPDLDMRNRARIGCRSNIGGCNSANSIAVIPHAQISHSWLYPPFLSTAATCTFQKY